MGSQPRSALVIAVSLVLASMLTPNVARATTGLAVGAGSRSAFGSEIGTSAPQTTWGSCPLPGTPVSTAYLPNVTKTLGGAGGWDTPFYVQNIGDTSTDLIVSFYRFSDGSLVTCRTFRALGPAQVVTDDPLNDPDLPDNAQFSVVVQSLRAPIAATVDQMQGSASTTEALSYTGLTTGSTTVYLPNVTRRFYGYDVPFIVQNMGSANANVTAAFVSFDSLSQLQVNFTILPGRSAVIDPNVTVGLVDGTQYAVSLTSTQPIGVVANAHNEAIGPVAFSHDGITSGSPTLYAPYATKFGRDGSFSPIVVQNVGASSTDALLSFFPLGATGAVQTFRLAGIPAGASRAFDPRFALGTTIPCVGPSATCLANGDYSLKITATSDIAALVLPNSTTTADAYLATSDAGGYSYLPIAMKTVGGTGGWNSTIYVQSAGASTATLRFYRTADYTIDSTTTIALSGNGMTTAIDLTQDSDLRDGTTYGVVVEGSDGSVATATSQHGSSGGDALMMYAGAPVSRQSANFVSGQVENGGTITPAASVMVSAIVGGRIEGRTSTDVNGHYRLPLELGTYLMAFDPPAGSGLPHQYADGSSFASTATPFTMSGAFSTLNVVLHQGFVISGRVTGSLGEPVAGANVVALPSGCPTCVEFAGTTDASGAFAVAVPGGSYRLHYVPAGGAPYDDLWYPSATSFVTATDISTSGVLTALNAMLPRAFLLSGTVRDASGTPIPGVSVTAFAGGATTCCTSVASGTADFWGRYVVAMPPGIYRVMFGPPGVSGDGTSWYGGTSFTNASDLAVSANTAGVDLWLGSGVSFGGVTFYNGVATSMTIEAYRGGPSAVCCELVYQGRSAVDGSFAFGLPPGTYRFRLSYATPLGPITKWIYVGTTFAQATDLTLVTNPWTVFVALP